MSFSVFCSVVTIFYVVLWFFDSFFKSCMHYPYFAFLEGTGLKIGIFNFSWTTTAFNRCLFRWSKNLARFLRRWFTCGYFITVFLFLPFALWTLFSIITRNFFDSTIVDAPEVEAILPGVNVPVSDFWVYFISIALCSIIHEVGHALAAGLEDVQLISVGVYIFTIVPVAFVQMNTEHLNSLDVGKRLRIYCAGVWHNIVLAFVAISLFFSMPILFSLAYSQYDAVKVVELSNESPLKDIRGLQQGDIITAINRCEVRSSNDWSNCLQQAHERFGICTPADYISQHNEIQMEIIKDNDVVECCRREDLYSLCFEYIEPKEVVDSGLANQYSCLKPRDMVTGSYKICTEANDYACTRGNHCLKPSLNNQTYLLVIERREDVPVIYMGSPYEVYKTMAIDEYYPRLVIFSLFSPSQFEKLLRYIFIFSMGIGFVNIIPCFGTDGHHIARNLVQIIAKRFGKDGHFVTLATISTVVIGTGLTVPLLVYLFYKAFFLG